MFIYNPYKIHPKQCNFHKYKIFFHFFLKVTIAKAVCVYSVNSPFFLEHSMLSDVCITLQ